MASIQFYRESNFKETPIGKIPKDWEIAKLKKIVKKIKAGGTPLTTIKEYWNGDIPFVKIEDISSSSKYLVKTGSSISAEGLKNSSAWMVPKNSLLLAMYGSLGELAINKIPVATNQAILGIIPRDEYETEFLYYWFSYFKPNWRRYAKPTTQANLTAQIVRNILVPFPSFKEQHGIVEVLSLVDLVIQKTDEIIAKTERLKKGLMQELLTKGLIFGFMFDTNIFDKVLDGKIDLPRGLKYYVTHIQFDEIQNMPDGKKERREKLLKLFRLIPKELIATEGTVLGISRLGMAKLTVKEDAELYEKMLKRLEELDKKAGKKKSIENQARDVLIALTCIKNCLTLVTNDENLKEVTQEFQGSAVTFKQFLRGEYREFKDTEIGRIPKEWKVARLKDVAKKFISGGTPSTKEPRYWNGDIPWIRSVHLSKHHIEETMIEHYITKEGLENSASNVVPKGSLIVATRVGIGKAAVNLIDVAINQDLTGILIDKSKLDPFFAVWYLLSPKISKLLESFGRGTTIKGIALNYVKNLTIPLPSMMEQQKIAQILSTVDKRLEMERNEKEKLERIKQALMDLLLTGKIRLRV